jgi:predicted transcriptional regulator
MPPVPFSPKSWNRPGVKAPEMPRSGSREIPPPLELECLKVLWTLGEGNVKDVRQALTGSRNLAYTTVMTVLDRLARKGGVARRKVGRSFVYAPVLSRGVLRRLAVQDLVDRFFEGSEDALIELLKDGKASVPAAAAGESELDPTLL